MNEWMYHLFVFSSPIAFFSPRGERFIWPVRPALTQVQVSVLHLRVISLLVSLGVVLLWLCARNCALCGQSPGIRTKLLREFLDTAVISSASVLCLHNTFKNNVGSYSFKLSPLLFPTIQHTTYTYIYTYLYTHVYKIGRASCRERV